MFQTVKRGVKKHLGTYIDPELLAADDLFQKVAEM